MPSNRKILAALVLSFLAAGCLVLPESQLPAEVTTLDQGWSNEDTEQFWFESQGTVMMPYDWFMALQTPEIKFVGSVDYFADRNYLSRYGFLYADGNTGPSPTQSPLTECVERNRAAEAAGGEADPNCGLPLGLAPAEIVMKEIDPNRPQEVVGFTCAACHTGELHFPVSSGNGEGPSRYTAVRIEGATNLVDVTQFQSAVGYALLLTQNLPFRFNRFAANVLDARDIDEDDDARAYAEAKRRLKAELDSFLEASSGETLTAQRLDLYTDHPGGFGRTDALARIANMVFGTEMENDDNLVVGAAPVKFPSIWDAPYFAWAQYNGSIEQSMTRNIGEALGTRARVDYIDAMNDGDPDDDEIVAGEMWAGERVRKLESTVDFEGLYAIETLLRGTGKEYFNGLRSPVWPGDVTWAEARAGEELYAQRCAACHLPPIDTLVQWGDRPNARGELVRGIVPRGTPVRQNPADPDSPIIGLADDRDGEMYWISNNHPEMLGDLRAGPYPEEELEYFLNLSDVNLGTIGTDPGQAADFAKNIINTGDILLPPFPRYGFPLKAPSTPDELRQYAGVPTIKSEVVQFPQRIMPAGVGLQFVTINLIEDFYDRVDAQDDDERQEFIDNLPRNLQMRDDQRDLILADGNIQAAAGLFIRDSQTGRMVINRNDWNGNRPPGAEVGAHYRPHPLNGVWASPPYLHNGSVPNIYQLLSPYEDRDEVFYTGNRKYDADHLGYVSERFRGGFRYDTSVVGNSNYGHLFQGEGLGNGVIGPPLDEGKRRQIIEYLKTLCPPGFISDIDSEQLCVRLPDTGGQQ